MLLPQQIQAILYHIVMGWIYGCLLFMLSSFMMYIRFNFIKAIIEIIFHILFVFGLYYGLYQINGGVTNPYLIALFFVGVYIFYRLYINVFIQLVVFIKKIVKPIVNKIYLVKSKILGIMKMYIKALRRRRTNGKKLKSKKRRFCKEEIKSI